MRSLRQVILVTILSYIYNDDPELLCLRIELPLKPIDILLNFKPGDEQVCMKKPVCVQKAATFIIDTSKLGSVEDIKADDLGAWNHKGKPVRRYKINRSLSGTVYAADKTMTQDNDDNIFALTRVYYHHKNTPVFRHTILLCSW